MYSDNELHELQIVLLEMIKQIDNICKKENIEYFLLGGTFIGAVRHKGFIPWDDDIDIAMDRKNYQKFLKIIDEKLPENMKLLYYKNDATYEHWIKIKNNDFKIIEKKDNIVTEQNVFIDIFPFDNIPDNFIKRLVFKIQIYLKTKKLRLAKMLFIYESNNQKFKKKYKNILVKLLKLLNGFFNQQRVEEEYDDLISKYKNKNTKLIANLCVNYSFGKIYREMFEKEKIREIVEYDFEDTKLKGLKNYDYLLGQTFGDYMKLPPKEEQVSKHFMKLIDLREEK